MQDKDLQFLVVSGLIISIITGVAIIILTGVLRTEVEDIMGIIPPVDSKEYDAYIDRHNIVGK